MFEVTVTFTDHLQCVKCCAKCLNELPHLSLHSYEVVLLLIPFFKRGNWDRNQGLTHGVYCYLKVRVSLNLQNPKQTRSTWPILKIGANTSHYSSAFSLPLLTVFYSRFLQYIILFVLLYFGLASQSHAQTLSPNPGFPQSCLREEHVILQVLASWTGVILEEVDTSHGKNVEEDEQQHQEEGHALEAMTLSQSWARLGWSPPTA